MEKHMTIDKTKTPFADSDISTVHSETQSSTENKMSEHHLETEMVPCPASRSWRRL